jgi:hypothetical protein
LPGVALRKVSVAVTDCVAAVLNVRGRMALPASPAENVWLADSVACTSELVTLTVPRYLIATLLYASNAVTVADVLIPTVVGEGTPFTTSFAALAALTTMPLTVA